MTTPNLNAELLSARREKALSSLRQFFMDFDNEEVREMLTEVLRGTGRARNLRRRLNDALNSLADLSEELQRPK